MKSKELERTFLTKILPADLERCESKELLDIYIPESSNHPTLRIRKNGNKLVITKKELVNEGDASHFDEYTIHLTENKFNILNCFF